MAARSYADRMCANYLTNLLFCQPLFPDSLLLLAGFQAVGTGTAVQSCMAFSTLGYHSIVCHEEGSPLLHHGTRGSAPPRRVLPRRLCRRKAKILLANSKS